MHSVKVKKTALIFFLIVYLSIIIWYDFRVLSARGYLASFDIQPVFQLWAALTFPFIMYFLAKISLKQIRTKIFIAGTLYFLVSIAVGLVNENPDSYILGDAFKYLVFISGFGLYSFVKKDMEMFFRLFCCVSVVYIIVRLIVHLYFSGSVRVYYGNVYDVISIGLLSIYVSEMKSKAAVSGFMGAAGKLAGRFSPVIVLIVLLGQKKVVMAGVVFNYLLVERKTKILVVFALSVFMGLFFSSQLLDFISGTRFSTVADFDDLIAAEATRLAESKAVLVAWGSTYSSMFFGNGFGATLEYFNPLLGPTSIHSIHNSYLGTLYRSGFFGIILIGLVLFYGVSGFVNKETRELGAMLLVVMFVGVFVYTVFDEIFVGFLLAMIIDSRSRA